MRWCEIGRVAVRLGRSERRDQTDFVRRHEVAAVLRSGARRPTSPGGADACQSFRWSS